MVDIWTSAKTLGASFREQDFGSLRVTVAEVLESDCRHVHELWNAVRGERFAPGWKDFDLSRLPSKVIAFSRVVDVRRHPFDLSYRFWGTGLVTVLGVDRTGKSIDESPPERARHTKAEYRAVIEEKAPYALVYNARSVMPAMPFYAPAIRLPLSDDGETVDKIVGYTDFNADTERWERIFAEKREREDPA